MTSMSYTVIAILCFIVTAFLIFSAVMAGRSSNADGVAIDVKAKYKRIMAVLIAMSIALGVLTTYFGAMAHTTAFAATGDTSSGSIETTSQITTEVTTTAAAETTKAEEEPPFEKGHFKVDLQKEDMGDWAAAHGYDIEKLRKEHSIESAPAYGDVRNEKILLAMREYISPTAIGFTDGVAWPMEDAFRWLYKNPGWGTLTDKEKWDLITEHAIEPYDYETIVNPTVCDMRLQDLAQSEYFSYMVADNEWLQDRLEKNNGYFTKTEEPIGNSNFYYKETEDGDLLLEDDQLLFAIRLCELERNAYVPDLDNPVQCRTSIKNWHLPQTNDANLARTELAKYQESRPALILYLPNKNGEIVEIKGRNLLDKRVLIYEVPKITPPPAETTTTTSRMTTTTPPPTTTTTRKTTVTTEDTELYTEKEQECTVIIKYRYWDDNGIVRKRSDNSKYDKKFTVPVGKSFSVNSPDPKYINRSGYRLKYDHDKTVSGIAEGTLWEYTVWYEKINDVILIIDNPTTTAPPPPVTAPPTTATTLPDGQGGKDPAADPVNNGNADVGGGPNNSGDGQGSFQGQTEPPREDYTSVATTPPTVTSRYETDGSGNVTATAGPVIGETPPVTTEIPVVTGVDHIGGQTDTSRYETRVTEPD